MSFPLNGTNDDDKGAAIQGTLHKECCVGVYVILSIMWLVKQTIQMIIKMYMRLKRKRCAVYGYTVKHSRGGLAPCGIRQNIRERFALFIPPNVLYTSNRHLLLKEAATTKECT